MTGPLSRLSDEIEIQRLGSAYSHACMRLDGKSASMTYAHDGVLSAFYKADFVGREAIADALVATLGRLQFLTQSCSAGVIEVAGDRATAVWTVAEFYAAQGDDAPSCCFGSYEDALIRTSEGWRFARRRFLPFYRGGLDGGKMFGPAAFEQPLDNWPPGPLNEPGSKG